MTNSYKKKRVKSKRRKHSRHNSRKKRKSNSKTTWGKFLRNKDSRKALAKSWSSDNPQKYYKSTIVKLAKKYSNKK